MKHIGLVFAALLIAGACGMMLYGVKVKISPTVEEELDLTSDEPISFETFTDLMEQQKAKNLPYIVARIGTRTVNGKDIVTYYDAHLLNYFLFKILGRAPLRELNGYADIKRAPIEKLDYFIINEPIEGSEARTQEFRHLCSFEDLKQDTARWAAELYKNQPAPAEQPLTPAELLDRAYNFYSSYNIETLEAVEPDYARAFADFSEVSQQTEDPASAAAADCMLGEMYRDGQGTNQNYNLAIEHYRRAADQRYDVYEAIEALESLGDMYSEGEGVAQDNDKARDYYEQAIARADDAAIPQDAGYAHLKLGDMDYAQGLYEQARQRYEKADAQGDAAIIDTSYMTKAEAQLKLGKMYFEGKGVQQSSERASQYFQGVMLSKQLGYVEDAVIEEAVEYLKKTDPKAASKADLQLGKEHMAHYRHDKAIEYLTLAADQRDDIEVAIEALIELGNLFSSPTEGYPDYDQVLQYRTGAVRLAEEHNHSDEAAGAYERLGNMYHYGLGVSQDNKKAISYYEKAATQNKYPKIAVKAQDALGELYYYAGDYAKARVYLEAIAEHADLENWSRMHNKKILATMYYKGLGGAVNHDQAKTYFNDVVNNQDASGYDKREAQEYLDLLAVPVPSIAPTSHPIAAPEVPAPVIEEQASPNAEPEISSESSPQASTSDVAAPVMEPTRQIVKAEEQVKQELPSLHDELRLGKDYLRGENGRQQSYQYALNSLEKVVNQDDNPALAAQAKPMFMEAVAGRIEELREKKRNSGFYADNEEKELVKLKQLQKTCKQGVCAVQ